MSPLVKLDSVDLYYREVGDGVPIILLHGLTLTGLMWSPQIKYLSNNYRLIIPDLRGHGRSSVPEHGYTFHDYAFDIKKLLDKISINKCHLIGLSLGGAVATEFCVAYPEIVISTTLISSMPPRFIPGKDWSQTVDRFRKKMNENGVLSAVENVLLKEPLFGKINIGIEDWMNLKNSIRQFSGNPLAEDELLQNNSSNLQKLLPMLDIPFLIITGENDNSRFIIAADNISGSLSNSKRVTIKNAGHLCSMEKPDEVNSEINKFLSHIN